MSSMHWNLRLKFHSTFFRLVKTDISQLISLDLCQFASTFTNLNRFETSKGSKISRLFGGFISGWSIMHICSSLKIIVQISVCSFLSTLPPFALWSKLNLSKLHYSPKTAGVDKTVLAVNCELLSHYSRLTDT